MDTWIFYGSAVAAGFVLIGLVVYSYVRPRPEHRPSVTALLGMLGFVLIASPNWTSISIKGEGLELSLIREMQARQLEALAELNARKNEGEAEAAPDAARKDASPRARRPEVRSVPSPTPTPPPPAVAPESGPGRLPRATARVLGALTPEYRTQLLGAFERGELVLPELSTEELLTLNELVTQQARAQ